MHTKKRGPKHDAARVEIKNPLQNVIPNELKAIYNLIINTTTFRYIHSIIELIYYLVLFILLLLSCHSH